MGIHLHMWVFCFTRVHVPCDVRLIWLLAAMIWSRPNETCLEPLGTGGVVDATGLEEHVSIATLAPPTERV